MNLEINKTYKIEYRPICSESCKVTCESCKVDTTGIYTGRNWVDRDGIVLYEFVYEKSGKRNVGIFEERELSLI